MDKANITTIVEFDLANNRFQNISIEEFTLDIQNHNKVYWIHCDLNATTDFANLIKKINLSDDVIDLCNETDTMPKIIDRDKSLTIQIQCLLSTDLNTDHEVNFDNLIIHLTDRFCFTASDKSLPVLTEFIDSYPTSVRYAKTPCFILFLLFDNAITDYATILFNFELLSEKMDEDIRSEHKNRYDEVMEIKQQVMKVKRYAIASREILMRISGRNISVISEECRASLYNLSNHAHMVVHEADSIRDMLKGFLDQIENTLMQRMSETMRILTVFASIFLPLTLITGIYGMNFELIPELHWKYGYFYALGLIIFVGIFLFFLFKKMKWF